MALDEVKLRETLAWLAGIISSGGSITKRKSGKGLIVNISSVDFDWVAQVRQRLSEIGIETTVEQYTNKNAFKIYLKHPFDVRNLLLKYGEPYMMVRKFKILQEPYSERHAFSTEQKKIIEEERRKGKTLHQIASKIGRSHMGVSKYLRKKGLR